jgi:histone H2B
MFMELLDKIATQASKLCRYSNKTTLHRRDIQSAVRLLFPGKIDGLASFAVRESTKACISYMKADENPIS